MGKKSQLNFQIENKSLKELNTPYSKSSHLFLRCDFCAERNCCCSEKRQIRKSVSWRENAKNCSQSFNRSLKTFRKSVLNTLYSTTSLPKLLKAFHS